MTSYHIKNLIKSKNGMTRSSLLKEMIKFFLNEPLLKITQTCLSSAATDIPWIGQFPFQIESFLQQKPILPQNEHCPPFLSHCSQHSAFVPSHWRWAKWHMMKILMILFENWSFRILDVLRFSSFWNWAI